LIAGLYLKWDYEFIKVGECGDGVQYIGLNRPDQRNAVNNRRQGELLQTLPDEIAARIKARTE
jgi:1,4-dihydroxy-2-naphthoyl-CoA synthase